MMMKNQQFTVFLTLALSLLITSSSAFTRSPPLTFHRAPAASTVSSTVVVAPSQPQQQQQQYHRQHHGSDVQIVLYMGWGPDPIWSTATVKSNDKACSSGQSVVLNVNVSPETAADYKIPGQYVQVRLDDSMEKPLFLAIASGPTGSVVEEGDEENASPEPSSTNFEFLVKKTDGNEWMTGIAPGTKIQVSQVLGNGFALQENLEGFKYDFPTQNLLLFAAGSGLAPLKAAMESGQLGVQKTPGGRTCRLYYGERTQQDLCYVDQYPAWEAAGFEVVPVLSNPDESAGWQGRSGYVQNALEEDGIAVPRNSGALLCGMKGMTEAVKEILTKAGVFEGRVLFNF